MGGGAAVQSREESEMGARLATRVRNGERLIGVLIRMPAEEIVEMLAAADAGHLYVGPEASITLYECFDAADALISDISSVVSGHSRPHQAWAAT